MPHLSQRTVFGESDLRNRLVEAGNRTAIHLFMHPAAVAYFDDAIPQLEIKFAWQSLEPDYQEAVDETHRAEVAAG